MNSLINETINEYVSKSKKKDYWSGSLFEPLLKLGSDERGELGEKIVNNLFMELTNLNIIWEGNQNINRDDGSIWDILINDHRTEIKTAMRNTSSAVWQHEKIVEYNCWDKVLFFDIDYHGIWFTTQNYGQIPFNNELHRLLKKKSTYHLGAWKFDLSLKQLKTLRDNKFSIFYDIRNENTEELKNFLHYHFE